MSEKLIMSLRKRYNDFLESRKTRKVNTCKVTITGYRRCTNLTYYKVCDEHVHLYRKEWRAYHLIRKHKEELMKLNEGYEEVEDDEDPAKVTKEKSLLATVELEQRAVFRRKYGLTMDSDHLRWERKLEFWSSCHFKILRHEIVDVDTEEEEILAQNDEEIEVEEILAQNDEEIEMDALQQDLDYVPEMEWV